MTLDRASARGRHLSRPTTWNRLDAWLVGLATLALLSAWWAAYFPGLMTVDTFQAWEQIDAGVYQDWHPVIHTWVMGLLVSLWDSPGVVSLAQVIGLAGVLGNLTRQLASVSVPRWARIALPILLACIPPVGKMVVTIWKDVPFGISVMWVFVEVIGAVGAQRDGWSWWRATRLGLALLNVLMWRHNGLLVAFAVLAFLWVAFRIRWRSMLVVTLVAVGGLALVKGPLYSALDAWPTPTLQSHATLVHDVGAIISEHEAGLSQDDRAFLEQILPLERWGSGPDGLYDCRQATGLIFARELFPAARYDPSGRLVPIAELDRVLYQNPDSNFLTVEAKRFRAIWFDSIRRWPLTFLGHRLCVSASAWSPVSAFGESPLVPGSQVASNSLGFETEPLSPGLKRVLDQYNRLWGTALPLSWRPAVVVYLGFLAAIVGWRRRRDVMPEFWAVTVPGFFAWLSVVLVTPGQSFRYVWPAYLCGWASLVLAMRSGDGERR